MTEEIEDDEGHELSARVFTPKEPSGATALVFGGGVELEPADIRSLVAASYADAAAHPEVYADLHGRVEVDRETGATRDRGGPSSENS